MNILDIIVIIPALWFAFWGFRRGLVIEIATLAALIMGVYAGIRFSGVARAFLSGNFNIADNYLPAASFGLTFVAVVALVFIIGKILEKFIEFAALGFLNRLAGALFGIIKGVVLLSVIFLLVHTFKSDLISVDIKEKSLFYNPVRAVAPMIWKSLKELQNPE